MTPQNLVAAVKAAKVLFMNGQTVTARGKGHHPMTSFRVIQIRRDDGNYYGKALDDGCWYPIDRLYGERGDDL